MSIWNNFGHDPRRGPETARLSYANPALAVRPPPFPSLAASPPLPTAH